MNESRSLVCHPRSSPDRRNGIGSDLVETSPGAEHVVFLGSGKRKLVEYAHDSPLGGIEARGRVEVKPEENPFDQEITMCSYTEYDGESGETMACGKPEHSPKVKHGNWRKV